MLLNAGLHPQVTHRFRVSTGSAITTAAQPLHANCT